MLLQKKNYLILKAFKFSLLPGFKLNLSRVPSLDTRGQHLPSVTSPNQILKAVRIISSVNSSGYKAKQEGNYTGADPGGGDKGPCARLSSIKTS